MGDEVVHLVKCFTSSVRKYIKRLMYLSTLFGVTNAAIPFPKGSTACGEVHASFDKENCYDCRIKTFDFILIAFLYSNFTFSELRSGRSGQVQVEGKIATIDT